MKQMVWCALALLSFAVHAEELSSFHDIVDAVANGKNIKFVMDVNECQFSSLNNQRPILSITPNTIMIVNGERITASDRHFSLDDPIMNGQPSFGYSKFNINKDGSTTTKITVMKANYEEVAHYQINCNLGHGFKVFSTQ